MVWDNDHFQIIFTTTTLLRQCKIFSPKLIIKNYFPWSHVITCPLATKTPISESTRSQLTLHQKHLPFARMCESPLSFLSSLHSLFLFFIPSFIQGIRGRFFRFSFPTIIKAIICLFIELVTSRLIHSIVDFFITIEILKT